MYDNFESDYTAALENFKYAGGAVRLRFPVVDPNIRAMEWGRFEKDEYTVPYGPWSGPGTASAGAWVYRYGTASAGTGSAYRVLVTRVHADVASREGAPVVVTVLSPWQTAYPMPPGEHDRSYIAEKLTGNRFRDGTLHGGDLAALTKLVSILLEED